jgi:thioredoxin-like negative regulator of GroEL
MRATILIEDIAPTLFDVLEAGMSHGDKKDRIALLRFLREIRPKTLEIILLLAWELLTDHEFEEARELLEDADFKHPCNARVKATLASVLFFTNVPLWNAYVAEVRSLPNDEEASVIVDAIESAYDQRLPGGVALVGFREQKAVVEIIHQQSLQNC